MIEERIERISGSGIKQNDRFLPKIIKWKGVNMIRNHSFLAAVQEMVDFSEEIDVEKIGIIGDPHSGKTTLGFCVAHCFHKLAKIPYNIRIFQREDLLNFKATLKTLTPVNHIIVFGDVSFLGAEANTKQIELVKQASTQIRHLEGGKDVKIVQIMDYHYLLGFDKYLRQDDFKLITTVGNSEVTNLENIVGSKYIDLIKSFQKYRVKAVTRKVWKIRLSRKEVFPYKYRDPFIPVLFYNNDTMRLIVTPKREWIDPICSKCSEAAGQISDGEVDIVKFANEGENNFGPGNFEAAVKLLLYINGMTTYGKHVVNAVKWIEKGRMIKKISLEKLAVHYGLELTSTRLRKSVDKALNIEKPELENKSSNTSTTNENIGN